MADDRNRRVVDRYAATLAANDLDAFEALFRDDAVETYPQSGERFRGGPNIRGMLENYPARAEGMRPSVERVIGSEDRWVMSPSFTALSVAGSGEQFTTVGRVRYPNGEEWHVIHLMEVRDGKIAKVTSYFAAPFDAPDWRTAYREGPP
ncbi:MAG: nuclear transport factor 2 family protein [Candidatus Limnocylindria bacterium]